LWQDDHIEVEGVTKNIYLSEISILQILDFFKDRMPWLKFKITILPSMDKNPVEVLIAKYMIFGQLSGLLSEVHQGFSAAFKRETVLEGQINKNEPTTH
jgi:hypothetical protein